MNFVIILETSKKVSYITNANTLMVKTKILAESASAVFFAKLINSPESNL